MHLVAFLSIDQLIFNDPPGECIRNLRPPISPQKHLKKIALHRPSIVTMIHPVL